MQLSSIVIPENVTVIGEGIRWMRKAKLNSNPKNVTVIGKMAFCSCKLLESVRFAEESRLKSIGEHAFAWCSTLKTIEIPASVRVLVKVHSLVAQA